VVSLSLKAQARTPSFGATAAPANPDGGTRDPNPITWRGAQVKNLVGLDERSATGLGADVGVLVVTVPAGSQAETDGFKNYDVILQLGGQGVTSLDDFNRLYNATTAGQKVVLGIHRNQQDTTITITR
jgi:S1-C subfamily serine protease